jgi:hypothetical protein
MGKPAFPTPRADTSLDSSLSFPGLSIFRSVVSPISLRSAHPCDVVPSFPSSKGARFVCIRDGNVVSIVVVRKSCSLEHEPGMAILSSIPQTTIAESAVVFALSIEEVLFCKPVTG